MFSPQDRQCRKRCSTRTLGDDGTWAQNAVIGSSDPWPVSGFDRGPHASREYKARISKLHGCGCAAELMDQVSHEAPKGNTVFVQSSVVVVGTLEPWYEAVALYFGASNTMILEYNTLHYRHPKMSSSTPDEYRAIHAARRLRFDVGASSSSFEHDGLGRYGDPINPNGDLQSTPMATCSPW